MAKNRLNTMERKSQRATQTPKRKKKKDEDIQKSTPKTPKKDVSSQYKDFKNSSIAPKEVKPKKKETSLQKAQSAFQTGQKVRASQQKNKVTNTSVTKPKSNVITDLTKPKNYDYKKDLEKAHKKGQNTTYLGTKQEKTETTLKSKKEQKKEYKAQKTEYYKGKDWKQTKEQLKAQNKASWFNYLTKTEGMSAGDALAWMASDEGKQYRKETYMESKDATKKAINKSIAKGIKDTSKLKSVNALTKGEFDKMVTASAMGKEQGNKYLASVDPKLAKKIGSKTAESAYKSKFMTGVLQGTSKADLFSGSVGRYNAGAKEAIQQTKDSGAYLAGYGVGLAGDMLMGGVASRGASLAEMAGQGAGKLFGRGVAKEVPTKALQEASEEIAKVSGKQGLKRFAQNRAGEFVAEAPVNVLDAVKMSLDTDGNLNKDEFRKWLLINGGATFGIGGAMEGIGAGLTRKLGNETLELMAKKEAGNITPEELEQLTKNAKKLSQKTKGYETISSDIANARLNNIERRSAKMAKEKAEAEAKEVPKGFHGGRRSRGQGEYTERAKQTAKKNENARWNAQVKKDIADTRARTPDRPTTIAEKREAKQTAKRHGANARRSAERSRNAEVRRLQDEIRTRREELAEAEARANKKDNTVAGHEQAVRDVERLEKEIKFKESQLAKASDDTLSGRIGKTEKNLTKENTLQGHNKAVAEHERVTKELADDSKWIEKERRVENALKKAKQTAKENPTPLNQKRVELAEKALENVKAEKPKAKPKEEPFDYSKMSPRRATTDYDVQQILKARGFPEKIYNMSTKEIYDAVKKQGKNVSEDLANAKRIWEEAGVDFEESYGKKKPRNAKEKLKADMGKYKEGEKKFEEAEAELKKQLDDLDKEGRRLGGQKKVATDPDRIADLEKGIESIDRIREDVWAQIYKLRRQKKNVHEKYITAKDRFEKMGGYATFKDDVAKQELELANLGSKSAEVKGVVEQSGFDYKPPKDTDNVTNGVVNATTKEKRGLNWFYHNVVRTAVFDNFDPLEYIARRLPKEQSEKMFAQINELRRAVKTGRAIVAEKGRNIYKKYDLTNPKNKAKLKDFDRYCFLKHELSRLKEGTGFTGLDEAGVIKEMQELERKYATNVDKETGEILSGNEIKSEIQEFQTEVRDYFRDLLKREVDAGVVSKTVADDFIERFPNYVPSYRVGEFTEILNKRTIDEIDVGKGMKMARGGKDKELVPLYNQMQVKTNQVLKRTELNKTLDLLCTASGVTTKELDDLVPFFKDMSPEAKANELAEAQIFTHAKDGRYKAVMYRNGSKIEMDIDKDVYDAIRRWSGEDRKQLVLAKLLNNPIIDTANSWFKKWITDYNLIFGVKNLKRDMATALFYTNDLKGFVKNMPKGFAVCMLPDKMLSKEMKLYKQAYQVYKENGGVISQFIARDSASDTFFDKANILNPLKYVENFNSAMETIPRMTEFISALDSKALKAGGDYNEVFNKLLKDQDAIADAMYRAKDVTLNFDRSGWLGQKLNRGLVPFFNPASQGLDKLGRKLISDNIKYGKDFKVNPTETMTSFLKMGAYFTGMAIMPTMAWNHMVGDYINGEVEGYEKQSDYNRYSNYLFPIGDGKFIKIPKARELASIQAMLDFAYDNMKYGEGSTWEKLFSDQSERDLRSMAGIAWEQTGTLNPFKDSLFAPIYNVTHNRTWYGGKIESGRDLDLREAGEYSKIWDENTSAVAKWIGNKYNMSPKKVDNVMDSYLGIIYDYIPAQTALKNDFRQVGKEQGWGKGLLQLTRTPWGNAFVIDSVFSNSNKSDYYNYVDKRNKKLEGLKEGTDEYNEVKAEITKDKNAYSYTSSQYDELEANIWLDKNLTMSQKKKYVRMLKQDDNLLWNERKDGNTAPSKDPMAVAWNMKDGNGKRIMSTKTILESCSYTNKTTGKNEIMDAYNAYHDLGGKSDKKFVEVTLKARDVQREAGDSLSSPRWEVVAYSSVLNKISGDDNVLKAYIDNDKKRNHLVGNAKIYMDHDGDIKNYKVMRKALTQGVFDLGYDYVSECRDGEATMILANARTKKGKQYRDLAYQANDWYILNRMNAGRCLDAKENGHYQAKDIKHLCDKYKLEHDDKYNWDTDKVVNAINKEHPKASNEVKSAMFVVITGEMDGNPFGEIGDYSLGNDTGVYCEGNRGWYRRGRRGRRGHGGGGGGRGSSFKPIINDAGSKSKVTNTSKKKSNLNNAYRKNLKKLREGTRAK